MPDIKTALSTAIAQWEDTPPKAQAPRTQVTNMAIKDMPVSQACFYYVKDNRGVTVNEALEALAKMGFSTRSTSSLIYAMIRQGTLGRVEGKLHTRSAEYIPVRKPQKVKDKATGVKQKAKHVEGIAALRPQATLEGAIPAPVPAPPFVPAPKPPVPPPLDIDAFVDGLNIHQFLKLRDKMNTLWREVA